MSSLLAINVVRHVYIDELVVRNWVHKYIAICVYKICLETIMFIDATIIL